jgi:carbonic anhydrase
MTMPPPLEHLRRFARETLGFSRELLDRSARNGKHPPALLVTCADAEPLAERLTQANPDGFCFASELSAFVPPASAVADADADALAATIEYAVRVLRVSDIVVCGHSHCRAMATLMRASLPGANQAQVTWWLERTAPLRDLIQSRYAHWTDHAQRQRAAELEAVLVSLENLPSYTCVREKLDLGTLRHHGWHFESATGELFAYNPAAGQFELLMTFAGGNRV